MRSYYVQHRLLFYEHLGSITTWLFFFFFKNYNLKRVTMPLSLVSNFSQSLFNNCHILAPPLSSDEGLTLQETSRFSSDAQSWEPSVVLHKQSGRTWLSSDILSKQAARQQISFRSRGPWWRESVWQEYVVWNDLAGAPLSPPPPASVSFLLSLCLTGMFKRLLSPQLAGSSVINDFIRG